MKVVFDTKPTSPYGDEMASRYQFPARYLPAATSAIGDWIVYRAPRRDSAKPGYLGVAKLQSIRPDTSPNMHIASMSDYLPFDDIVPLVGPDGAREAILRQTADPKLWGRTLQGKSVRGISEGDFAAIVLAGMRDTLSPEHARRLMLDRPSLDPETSELLDAPPVEQERRIEAILVNRKIRDAAFRHHVVDAYDGRCAVTGIRLINGGGRAEVQAAHIWPVAEGGPDTVANGIALSATVHWLFDRHLISLTDDYGLLVAHNRVPIELRQLFTKQLERVHLPDDARLWPDIEYVRRHRGSFAAG